jgi:hypothetical protein
LLVLARRATAHEVDVGEDEHNLVLLVRDRDELVHDAELLR